MDQTHSDELELHNRLVMEQRAAIQNEIAENQPIISDLLPFDHLRTEYLDNFGFLQKIPVSRKQYLEQKYSGFRRVRGDGNCFYRSFLFSLLEQFIECLLFRRKSEIHKTPSSVNSIYTRVLTAVQGSNSMMETAGYHPIVYEDYLQIITVTLSNIEFLDTETLCVAGRKQQFLSAETANGLVMFMRFLTAAYLKQNEDMFFPFLEGYFDIADFCQREVEPMDKESEQMQIMALQQALGVPILIEEINSMAGAACRVIRFPDSVDDREFAVRLLFRPGHYDILYSK